MSCRPDWIRLVGPASQINWLLKRVQSAYGEYIPHSGAMYYHSGAKWHCGMLVSWGHQNENIMIDLQGSYLACTPVEEFMQLTTEILMHGFHCTRIDPAVDHVGMDLALYDHALASCNAGELCKLRSYSPKPEHNADCTPTSRILYLGKRSSPICARIYDKGLETGTLPAGQWERFEVEFKDDRANDVCMTLCSAGDRMREALWRYVIGAVDFREANGRSELNRRPRVKWWDDYIGSEVPLECPPCPKESSFDTWWEWARTSFAARFLQFAKILEVSPQSLLIALIEELEPAQTESPATIDLRSRLE